MSTYQNYGGLPDPRAFKPLMEGLPHYADEKWYKIFSNQSFCRAVEAARRGTRIVTDLDHTLYHADAGFMLLEAAIHEGLIKGVGLQRYHTLWTTFHTLPSDRSVEHKARDEFQFFCDILTTAAGIPLKTLEDLSERVWERGFAARRPLKESIYPEIAYLFAVAGHASQVSSQGVVAVTASPDFAVVPALKYFHIPRRNLCAMIMDVDAQGLLLPSIKTTIYGPSKVTAASAIFSDWDYAFGDNPLNDGPFLALAKQRAFGIGPRMQKRDGIEHLMLCTPPAAY